MACGIVAGGRSSGVHGGRAALDDDGWLGDFSRGPAVFSVFRTGSNGGHPLPPPEYRATCNDGAGPREICRFTEEPEFAQEWFGAWRSDQCRPWIPLLAKGLLKNPEA
jgi:hypothetical protein